jgi:hypothetical protein
MDDQKVEESVEESVSEENQSEVETPTQEDIKAAHADIKELR